MPQFMLMLLVASPALKFEMPCHANQNPALKFKMPCHAVQNTLLCNLIGPKN